MVEESQDPGRDFIQQINQDLYDSAIKGMKPRQLISEVKTTLDQATEENQHLPTPSPTPSAYAAQANLDIDTTSPLRNAVVNGEEMDTEYDPVTSIDDVTEIIHQEMSEKEATNNPKRNASMKAVEHTKNANYEACLAAIDKAVNPPH